MKRGSTPARISRFRGFTKAEMLIVCAILVIVSVVVLRIAFEAPTPKISRTKGDLRIVAAALEAYFLDHRAYPVPMPLESYIRSERKLRRAGGLGLAGPFGGDAARAGLTTPVAYIKSILHDQFAPEETVPLAYHTDGKGWILFSPGPDKYYDIVPAKDYNSSITQPSHSLVLKTYDPTNGMRSKGDVWRSFEYVY